MIMFFQDSRGRRLSLKNKLGSGSEATAYEVIGSPRCVAKVFHRHDIFAAKRPKIEALVAEFGGELPIRYGVKPGTPPWHGELAVSTPADIIVPVGHAAPSGIVSPRVHHSRSLASVTRVKPVAQQEFAIRLGIAINLAQVVAELHDRGILVVNWNPWKILLTTGGRVALVDADNFQVGYGLELHRATVAMTGYIPPWCCNPILNYPAGQCATKPAIPGVTNFF